MPFEQELQVAQEAARRASEFILAEYERFEVIPDAPAHISTAVDVSSQELILKCLREHCPDDSLIAEEATPTLREAPAGRSRVWIVDPIDGTRGFARKNGEFSVMIALAVDGEPKVGVVLEPVLHRWTYATRDGGCWVRLGSGEAARCQMPKPANLEALSLTQSRSRPDRPPTRAVRQLKPTRIDETYSAGVKLAKVARGDVDLYVNTAGFRDWDICAGQILVEEAGGIVTDFAGRPFDYADPGTRQGFEMIACHRAILDDIVRRLTGE